MSIGWQVEPQQLVENEVRIGAVRRLKRVDSFFFEQQFGEQQQLVEASAAVEGAGDRDGVASGSLKLGDVTGMLSMALMDRGCQ